MKVLVLTLVAVFLIGCASFPKIECPPVAIGKIISKLKEVPEDKWSFYYNYVSWYYKLQYICEDFRIGISRKGNLFLDGRYIHIPWELKKEVQKLYVKIVCARTERRFEKAYHSLNKKLVTNKVAPALRAIEGLIKGK
jgi:hypothetical protein